MRQGSLDRIGVSSIPRLEPAPRAADWSIRRILGAVACAARVLTTIPKTALDHAVDDVMKANRHPAVATVLWALVELSHTKRTTHLMPPPETGIIDVARSDR